MSSSEQSRINEQQLDYGSVLWQRHRDFFSKKLSVRARGMLPTVINDIVWPESLEDFSKTIQKRYIRNPEPFKRVSYSFQSTRPSSNSASVPMFTRKQSQLEARQTETEREFQLRIEDALTDNLQYRQTSRNMLLDGSPGTGKTSMVQQVLLRMDIPKLQINSDYIMNKFVGETGKFLTGLFEVLRVLQPICLVLDECDSVFRTREDGMADDYRRDLLTKLLPKMGDNFEAICGLIIVAMTNRPDVLDTAIMSRFMGNTFTIRLTEEVRSVVWYNQLSRCTFSGVEDGQTLNKLASFDIQDLRVISWICSNGRSIIRGRRIPRSLEQSFSEYSSVIMINSSTSIVSNGMQRPGGAGTLPFTANIIDSNCVIWFLIHKHMDDKRKEREMAATAEATCCSPTP